MERCDLQSILAIYTYAEAYTIRPDGTNQQVMLAGPPPAYRTTFLEWYCMEHDCSFKNFKAVLSHVGETEMLG